MFKKILPFVALCLFCSSTFAAVCVEVTGEESVAVSSFDRLMVGSSSEKDDMTASFELTVSGCDLLAYRKGIARVERASAADSPKQICKGDTLYGFNSSNGFLGACFVQDIWVHSQPEFKDQGKE